MQELNEESLLLIHKYFRNELSAREAEKFEEELADENFRAEVKLQAIVFQEVLDSRRDDLTQLMHEAKAELEHKSTSLHQEHNKTKSKSWVVLTLVVMTLAAVGIFIMSPKSEKQDYSRLYAQYYKPYDTPESQRGNNEIKETPLTRALFLYEDQNYKEALSTLEGIEQNDDIQMYKTQCLMNLDLHQKAEAILLELLESKNKRIRENAQWYLTLSYLQRSDAGSCKKLLTQITTNPSHLYYNLSKRLTDDL